MKVTVFGKGYVGLVQGTVLADAGHYGLCVAPDQAKVDQWNQGKISIYEPGLEQVVRTNYAHERLSFTTDAAKGVRKGELQFNAVGSQAEVA